MITLAMGAYLALSAGAVFASGNEHHEGRNYEHDDRHNSKIYGKVQSLPDGKIGAWNVNGKEIEVSHNTLIREKHGEAEIGSYVEVEGTFSGKTMRAHKIEVKRENREMR
jgi:hypothetical protein